MQPLRMSTREGESDESAYDQKHAHFAICKDRQRRGCSGRVECGAPMVCRAGPGIDRYDPAESGARRPTCALPPEQKKESASRTQGALLRSVVLVHARSFDTTRWCRRKAKPLILGCVAAECQQTCRAPRSSPSELTKPGRAIARPRPRVFDPIPDLLTQRRRQRIVASF